jgi:hypothetical protein
MIRRVRWGRTGASGGGNALCSSGSSSYISIPLTQDISPLVGETWSIAFGARMRSTCALSIRRFVDDV